MLSRVFALLDSRFLTRVGNLGILAKLLVAVLLVVTAASYAAVELSGERWWVLLIGFGIWLTFAVPLVGAYLNNRRGAHHAALAQDAAAPAPKPSQPSPATPLPRPLVGVERAVIESLIASEDLLRERQVKGDQWFGEAVMEWASETTERLDRAKAGDLLTAFFRDGIEEPNRTQERVAYLSRQVALLQEARQRLSPISESGPPTETGQTSDLKERLGTERKRGQQLLSGLSLVAQTSILHARTTQEDIETWEATVRHLLRHEPDLLTIFNANPSESPISRMVRASRPGAAALSGGPLAERLRRRLARLDKVIEGL